MESKKDILYFRERGSGSPLLLLHGVMITGEMFEPIVDHLAKQHRVIIPDLRGHGHSRELPTPYGVPHLASDLSNLLKHLGIESADVLGYSQGGAVAQQLVLDYPEQCNRLVLACTYAFNAATFREKIEGHIAPLLINVLGMQRFAKLVISVGLKQVEKDRSDWVIKLIGNQDPKLMIAAWKAAMEFDSRPRLKEIKCSTLIIAGSKDDAVPLHHAYMLHEGIADSKLTIIDGADHALIWARPRELERVLDEWGF